MADPASAAATQLANIEAATGSTVAEWTTRARAAGKAAHGEILGWLKADHGLTHGNANALAHAIRRQEAGGDAAPEELLEGQYSGGKAALRPVHDAVVAFATGLGGDVQVVVQKTGVSLRRRRQFALVDVPSAKRVRLGLNIKGAEPSGRVTATKGMCTHTVDLMGVDDVDDEVRGWLARAYDAAG